MNSQFGQGTDGSATGSVSLDRRAGGAVTQLSVTDLQWWSSLSVGVSSVFADASGKVIAFTPPHTVTANGVIYSWPYGTSTASGTFTDSSATPTLDPATTVNVRMARVLLVRDGATELQSTLSNAVQLGQTLASVLSALGIA